MAALTREQEAKANAAAAASLRAHRAAQKLPEDERLEARARQAQTYIDTIDSLGIPRDHEKVAHLIRQAEGNFRALDRHTTPSPPPPPIEVPYDVRFPRRACPMPGCSYEGPRGTCPAHDAST
jgi:hypothetical protein